MGERRGRSRSPVRSGQGAGGEAREGDWTCPRCKCNNFARRVECFKCQTEKKMDWICKRCDYENFAKRIRCFSCDIPKDTPAYSAAAATGRARPAAARDPYEEPYHDYPPPPRARALPPPRERALPPPRERAIPPPRERALPPPRERAPLPPRARALPLPRDLPPRDYARDYPPPPRRRALPPRDYLPPRDREYLPPLRERLAPPLRDRLDRDFTRDYPPRNRDRFAAAAGPADEWECTQCGTSNYAHRERCFTCPSSRPRALTVRRGRRSITPEPVDPGDWVCRDCHTNNFRRKDMCFGCKKPKNEVTRRPTIKRGERVMESKDWACRECDNMVNFARRTECYKCKKPRKEVEKERGEFKLGDWKCKDCLCNNFAKRTECFKCKVARADCEVSYDSHGHVVCNGDWTCLECKENNFAKRVECFKCQKTRPGHGDDAAQGSNNVEKKVETSDVVNGNVVEINALVSTEYNDDDDVVKMESEMSTDVVNLNFGEAESTDVKDDVVMAPE